VRVALIVEAVGNPAGTFSREVGKQIDHPAVTINRSTE